ncbi:filamentous hemagglutinin family protein [Nitrosomonas sp. Nm84]|uniref:two-partner secretion domain-containing protein n=1 Tax=Nitrosomonas sp. Nm84 TaxID=200124 RepID=UPI000D760B30|nr:caspase family protein [Nitrosomonas sp. Nm84]PXW82652.1 filamentous hemagglutinin family protein [Nitrosomonas sp. Nm84]
MVIKYFLALWMTLSLIGYSLTSYAQLPIDPSIVHGHAVIDTAGNHMTIINTPNTILDWQSFSIGTDSSVYFQQQSAESMILNRVTGNDASHIFGSLGSNGHIWLINPYGVLFGEHARIDAAGLVASTLDIANIDFLAKKYHFNSTGTTGEIKNQGEIRTSLGGRVWLMGDRVQNDGLVQTPSGQTVIAAGKSVEFVDSGAPNIVVRVKAPENEVVNLGSLVATSGQVDLHSSIVNQEGIVRVNSLGTDAAGHIVLKADQATLAVNSQTQADKGSVHMEVSSTLNNWGAISGKEIALTANEILQKGQISAQSGNVALTAKTSTYLDGSIDVSNVQGTGGNIWLTTNKLEGMAGGALRADGEQGGNIRVDGNGIVAFSSTLAATGNKQGGTIEVTGDQVYLLNADVNASGGTQGGAVHLGGGWQGGGELPYAREVLVGVGSEVKANGGTDINAKGGEIVVWSTQSSEHYGSLQAKNGGHIELSSKGEIRQIGDMQVGVGGEVLFDPKNLIITDNPPDNLALARILASGSVNGKPELASGDNFGTSVALDGDRLAVGAPRDDTSGRDRGAVHLFTGMETDNMTGLTWQKVLTSSSGAIGMPSLEDFNFFGTAVALGGDRLAVGARGAILSDSNHGAVYLFSGVGADFSGLTWQKSLTSGTNGMPVLSAFDFFGTSLAMDGDRLAIGASGDSASGKNSGAVHLFAGLETNNMSGLAWQKKLSSDTGANNMPALADSDFFGWSLAMDGDRLAVGVLGDSLSGGNRGAVHLFTGMETSNLSGLTWQKKLFSDTGANNMPALANSDFFGWSLAMDGDRLAVGAFGDSLSGSSRGAVHLFTGLETANMSGLTWQQRLASGTGANNMTSLADGSGFGWSLALDGDRLAVGILSNNGGDSAVYLFNGISKLSNGMTDTAFAANPSATSYITPASITALLDAGTFVTLQANNDITVQSDITAGKIGTSSNLMLQAGRNISLDANITTNNGNFTAIAGDSATNSDFRDPGTPTVTIANNASLNVGSGLATIAAVNGDFINNNGDSAIVTDGVGRWLVYASNPASSLEGFSPANHNKDFNQSFALGNVPGKAAIGNWFFYSKGDINSTFPNPVQKQETLDTLVQSVNASASGAKGVRNEFVEGKVIDMMSSLIPNFGRLDLARMSRAEMQLLVNDRKEFKQALFADAIYRLELDPRLSDVPLCSNIMEVNSGLCRISADQSKEYKSGVTEVQPLRHKNRYKTKVASIPQIGQKFVVLFGIDKYVDKTIPSLENAIIDAEVVGQLFADKLGYEALVVRNATRADIVRTLNQLSTEMAKNDSVVVYYAGHGYQNEKTGAGYWIPSDASAKDPASWISNASISEMLSGIHSNQIMMISDSCYSGVFTREEKLKLSDNKAQPVDILANRSVVAMSAGNDEPVADEGRGGHSIFAWYLMQTIRNVDNWKLGNNIFEQVQREVRKSFPQTPQYGAIISAGYEKNTDYLFEFRQLEAMH